MAGLKRVAHSIHQDNPHKDEHYPPDRGCALAPKCLECPFPDCIEGNPEHQAQQRAARYAEIARLADAGLSRAAIAEHVGFTERTVQRVVKKLQC
jgi:DNA-binding NarL/FixJ family response regulator